MRVQLTVSGFQDDFTLDDKDIERIHLAILRKISSLMKNSGERIVILLAGPPGSGKSTIAAFWELLSARDTSLKKLQCLSIDGFHYTNSYLTAHMKNESSFSLYKIKGAPETYNVEALIKTLYRLKNEDVLWPEYDRNLHDPVENQISVTAPIVVVEGNWVLLNQEPWNYLKELADITIFIEAKEQVLKQRLIKRKLRGGFSEDFVQEHYRKADQPNINLVMTGSYQADIVLELQEMNILTMKSILLS